MKTTPEQYISELKSINIETISRCNMEKDHCNECPIVARSEVFGNFVLPFDVITNLVKELSEHGYKGRTGFHHYSDPMVDKRIFDIVEMHIKLCPQARTQIWTNGRLLSEEKAKRLLGLGLTHLHITAYTDEELIKYRELADNLRKSWPDVVYDICGGNLDSRMSIYTDEPNDITVGCPRITDQLVITSSGDIQLCCWDWLKKNKFGNIKEHSLIEILKSSNFLSMRDDLMLGKRKKYYPCDRCTVQHGHSPDPPPKKKTAAGLEPITHTPWRTLLHQIEKFSP